MKRKEEKLKFKITLPHKAGSISGELSSEKAKKLIEFVTNGSFSLKECKV